MITKSSPLACIEPVKFILVFCSIDLRLGSTKRGAVVVNAPGSGQSCEQWYVDESESIGDGAVALRSVEYPQRFLSSTSEGRVMTTVNEEGRCEEGSKNIEDLQSAKQWRIEQAPHRGVFLVSIFHGRILVCDDHKEIYTLKIGQEGGENWMAWKIEVVSGELCFVSSPAHDRRLKCDPFGNISMSKSWKGWEVWRFLEAGDGHVYIIPWTHTKYALSSDPDGNVHSSFERRSWEKWAVTKATGGVGVIFRSEAHGKVLGCDGKKLYTADDIDGSEIWHIEAANRGVFFLSSILHDKRIGYAPEVGNKSGGVFITENRKANEKWIVEDLGHSEVALRSTARGGYLGSNKDGELTTSATLDDTEVWCVDPSLDGGIKIISNAHQMHLSCTKEGKLRTVLCEDDIAEEGDAWNLEPFLPSSLSGRQLGVLCAGGAVTVACAAAMPFAVIGVLGGCGFTAEGIAAGSSAAAMMSAEAAASGGAVAAGGMVATLQSFGAAGLGLTGMSAAIGGGALIGGSVSAVTIAGTGILRSAKMLEDNGISVGQDALMGKRPFCAWRSW